MEQSLVLNQLFAKNPRRFSRPKAKRGRWNKYSDSEEPCPKSTTTTSVTEEANIADIIGTEEEDLFDFISTEDTESTMDFTFSTDDSSSDEEKASMNGEGSYFEGFSTTDDSYDDDF